MNWKGMVVIVFGLLAVVAGLYASGWITIKLGLGVVLIALYVLAWVTVVLLGLELIPRRQQGLLPHRPNNIDGHSDRETNICRRFTTEDDVDGEGARPSSLIHACNMPDPGRGYELMLMRELMITNERTVRELGPLPPSGLPVQKKAKPKVPYRDFQGNLVPEVAIIEENDEMKPRQMAAAVAMTIAGTLAACDSNHDAAATETENGAQKNIVTIRTESYPRPPSSEAMYYIYEQNGEVICTKFAICDKYGNCEDEYKAGTYRAEQDIKIGRPYGSTPPVVISPEKLSKHVCLTKHAK